MATDSKIITTQEMFTGPEQPDVVSTQEMFGLDIIKGEPVPREELRQRNEDLFLKEGMESGNIEPVEPGFIERFRADLPQAAGGLVGAAAFERAARPLTSKIPNPLLQLLARGGAAVGGAVLGGAGGTGFKQLYRMTRPGAKPETISDLYTEQLIAGLEEGASELAGRGLAKGLGIAGRAFGRRIVAPGAKAAAKLLQKSDLGITLAQATDNRLIDLMESVAEGSLVGGGGLQKLKTILIPKALKKAVGSLSDDFARAMGKLTPEEAGDVLLDALTEKNTAFKRASRSIYKQVDKLVKRSGQTGDIVDVGALKKFAEGKLKSKVNVLRSTTGDTLLESILALPDRITFKQATSLRSALLTQARTMSATKDVALGATKQLAKLTDGAIEKGGKQLSGDALDMWRFANKFHREGKEVFNSKIIKSLSKTLVDNPEKAVPRIFQKNATKQIKLLKNTVDEPTWDVLKSAYIESLLQKSQSETGDFIGGKFLKSLDDEVLKATFDSAEIASIKELGNAAELLQRPASGFGSTGRIVVAMTQAGAITGSAFTKKPGLAAKILLTPYALARISTNKVWSKLLIEGMNDPVRFAGSLARVARIAAGLDLENVLQKKKMQDREGFKRVPGVQPRTFPRL